MKLVEGCEYQVTHGGGVEVVGFYRLVLMKKTYEGLRVFRCGASGYQFTEDGRAVVLGFDRRVQATFGQYLLCADVPGSNVPVISEVNEDTRRRHAAGEHVRRLCTAARSLEGKLSDPFACGTADDEMIDQVRKALHEVEHLVVLLISATERTTKG